MTMTSDEIAAARQWCATLAQDGQLALADTIERLCDEVDRQRKVIEFAKKYNFVPMTDNELTKMLDSL